MKGFPGTIKTKGDLNNCVHMVKNGDIAKEQLLTAIESMENREFLHCPIVEATADRKTITIRYCPEVTTGECGNANIKSFEHLPDDSSPEMDSGPAFTRLVLKTALPSEETTVKVKTTCNCLETYGLTHTDLEKAKEAVSNVE